jgi:hypothetical protein
MAGGHRAADRERKEPPAALSNPAIYPCEVPSKQSKSGSFAIFTAILRASPLLSNFAAERRPGSLDAEPRVFK